MLACAMVILAFVALPGCGNTASEDQAVQQRKSVIVYGSTGLSDVLGDVLKSYTDSTGVADIEPSYEGSTSMSMQIDSGATVDLFIASDEKTVTEMSRQPTFKRPWLRNRLVVVAAKDTPGSMDDLLKGEGLVAIGMEGSPVHDFTRLGLRMRDEWDAVRTRCVQLADTRSVLGQVTSGGAVCGIVYETDAKAAGDAVRVVGAIELPDGVEVTYVLAAYTDAGAQLAMWLLTSPEANAAAKGAGFEVLGSESTAP